MSTTSSLSETLRRVLAHPPRGIAGLVGDLLAVCPAHGLQLDWHANRCRVRSAAGDGEEMVDVPLRKSAFRAILARVAALCNERAPNSVSPYGGQGELSAGANSAAVFRVAFVNTLAAQRLELRPAGQPADGSAPWHEAAEADRQLVKNPNQDTSTPKSNEGIQEYPV